MRKEIRLLRRRVAQLESNLAFEYAWSLNEDDVLKQLESGAYWAELDAYDMALGEVKHMLKEEDT